MLALRATTTARRGVDAAEVGRAPRVWARAPPCSMLRGCRSAIRFWCSDACAGMCLPGAQKRKRVGGLNREERDKRTKGGRAELGARGAWMDALRVQLAASVAPASSAAALRDRNAQQNGGHWTSDCGEKGRGGATRVSRLESSATVCVRHAFFVCCRACARSESRARACTSQNSLVVAMPRHFFCSSLPMMEPAHAH